MAHSLNRRRAFAHATLFTTLTGGAVLFLWPPARYPFYPACPIHALLGIQCPGCGATRALAALLHGKIAQAFYLNALFVLLLPFALAGACATYRRALSSEAFQWPRLPPPALYAALGLTAVFTLVRNL